VKPDCRIAITPGEPAGIGPDLLIKYCQQSRPYQLIAIANASLLEQRAKELGLTLTLHEFQNRLDILPAGHLYIDPVALDHPVIPGQLNPENSTYVLLCLHKAITGCTNHSYDALVTGPVNKAIINQAGFTFSGHTEFLAEHTNTTKVVMMLANKTLRVALATTHLPLSEVPLAITKDNLRQVLHILSNALQTQFGIHKPTILVCGLNPHAGEDGHLGREEIEIIQPALDELRQEGLNIIGPLPADTLFTPKNLKNADAVLAMYHDQGLPVLKYCGFGQSVNITLGLPMIRTSVDHGTALELAATGNIDTGSLHVAVTTAFEMSR
jgi:4-hydroxythreonine-4-phosphate dehydrogenase